MLLTVVIFLWINLIQQLLNRYWIHREVLIFTFSFEQNFVNASLQNKSSIISVSWKLLNSSIQRQEILKYSDYYIFLCDTDILLLEQFVFWVFLCVWHFSLVCFIIQQHPFHRILSSSSDFAYLEFLKKCFYFRHNIVCFKKWNWMISSLQKQKLINTSATCILIFVKLNLNFI